MMQVSTTDDYDINLCFFLLQYQTCDVSQNQTNRSHKVKGKSLFFMNSCQFLDSFQIDFSKMLKRANEIKTKTKALIYKLVH